MSKLHSKMWTRLDRERQDAIVRRAQRAHRKSRDWLLRASRRTVRNIARYYRGRGLPLEDLESEGLLGIFRAIEAYDPERGLDFMSFASFYIRNSIGRSVNDTARTVRLPSYLAERLPRVQRAIAELRERLEREPSAIEVTRVLTDADTRALPARLARRLGRAPHPDEFRAAQTRIRRAWFRIVPRVMDYFQAFSPAPPPPPLRAATPVAAASDASEWVDRLGADDTRRAVERALATLEPKEELVLRLRWGIVGPPDRSVAGLIDLREACGRTMTLQKVGEHLKLTRERVRQIEATALERLERAILRGKRER